MAGPKEKKSGATYKSIGITRLGRTAQLMIEGDPQAKADFLRGGGMTAYRGPGDALSGLCDSIMKTLKMERMMSHGTKINR